MAKHICTHGIVQLIANVHLRLKNTTLLSLKMYLGLRSKDMAHIVGRSTRTLKKNPKSEKVQKELRKIGYILKLLKEMTQNRSKVQLWLRAPNPEYGGLSPREVISKGKIDSVIGYLEDIMRGLPA